MTLPLRPRAALVVPLLLASLAALLMAPPADAFAPIQTVRSPGGIVAWLVEDHSVPIVSLEASFAGGAATDPAGKEGLANLTADLLTEGAGEYDSQAFQARLEDRVISLDFDAGSDRMQATLRTLSRDRTLAFDMLRLALTQPRFDAEPIERVKAQVQAQIRRSRQDPRSIVNRAWFTAAFPNHPYGRPGRGTQTSVAKIERADMVGFVGERFGRDGLIVSVVGDIQPAELASLLDATFGTLPQKAKPVEVPPIAATGPGGVMVIQRGIPQSVVSFGQPGILRSDPDFIAAYVLNHILGGGSFGSRMMSEIREKRGLVYSVGTGLAPYKATGLWMGSLATQNGRVAQSIDLVRQIWRDAREKGISPAELADAKTYLVGSYALRFDGSRAIASALTQAQEDNLGVDYFERRNSLIQALTVDDLNRVAKRLLDPDGLVFVVVGQPTGVQSTRPAPEQPS